MGSYGNDQSRAGKCYRISVNGADRDLIVQDINQGGDVPDGNFDIQVADGGFGIYDACTASGTGLPQFWGDDSQWGQRYGGSTSRAGCDKMPQYPVCWSNDMDDMRGAFFP